MKSVKIIRSTMAIAAVMVVASVAFGVRPNPSTIVNVKKPVANEPGLSGGGTAAAVSLNYATGFEPVDGFVPGHINNQPLALCPAGPGCWKVTAAANASLVQGHVNTVHPFAGTQHLRLDYDAATRTNQPAFGLGVDARSCGGLVTTCVPNTGLDSDITLQMAMLPFGMDYKIQPQSVTVAVRDAVILFFYTGTIYMEDLNLDQTALVLNPAGFWDTTGGYQPVLIDFDACTQEIRFSYGAPETGSYTATLYSESAVEQLLVFGDNFPGPNVDGSGAPADFDDVRITTSDGPCPSTCGANGVEAPSEQCDFGPGEDAACPGRCGAIGTPEECTCAPICTEANPCPVVNGANGPYVTSDGFYTYAGGSPFVSIDTCGSSFDSFIDVTGGATGYNDNCNTGQFGADSDPSASCYDTVTNANAYPSCLCVANGGPMNIQVGSFGFLPGQTISTTFINVRKKSVCAGASVGACCDTNGADQGCTDNAVAADCVGADKVFTDQGKCMSTHCVCIPLCSQGPAPCGDDGCGGSCGTCGDSNVCNGEETCGTAGQCVPGTPLVCDDGNACNGVETCDPQAGCRPGQPLNCDNGQFCDGVETCNPSSGCVSGTAPNCDDGQDCSVDSCNEETDACESDDSDCSIPTVSEWGLVVLTLMLLIGAKVYFGRRQAIA